LEEERESVKGKLDLSQQRIKRWFDNTKVGSEEFQFGDVVLIWDKQHEEKGSHTKFQKWWLGPFQIVEKMGRGTYKLKHWRGS